jgi:tripartite-type tricarboxylate transporter receptor subunit TctC
MCLSRIAGLAALLALAAFSGNAVAQKYPARPVRLVVPFAPGGGSDIMARVTAQKMSEVLGQSVVVDNRAGGGGTMGAEVAVRAAPDGYTLLLIPGSYAANAALYKLPYDPVMDIQPIILLGEAPFLVTLHPSVPIKSVKELIAYNKSNPGKLNYATPGTGGTNHLATELFIMMSGAPMTHVPYKGSGPALNDVLGGQVQVFFGTLSVLPHVRSGRLRAIAVSTAKRVASLPDMPTIGETVRGYEAVGWWGFCGPKGIPGDIVKLWNREVNRILQSEDMKKRLEADSVEPVGSGPEHLLNAIKRDVEKWKKVVKEAKITVTG